MKLLKRSISEKDGDGTVSLIAQIPEDMWHLYNLMVEGDVLRASTFRKVVTTSSTGSSTSEKKRVTLTLKVEAVEFDPKESQIRVKGRNIEENRFVKLGAYHTIDLEINRKFTLQKDRWDAIFLDRLETACDVGRTADLAAVVMQNGLAYVCLITPHMTVTKAKIEQTIPKKGRGSTTQHDKAVRRFYEAVLQSVIRHVDFDVVKCLLVASPGFIKESFMKYMYDQAVRRPEMKHLFEHKKKIALVKTTSGHKHALNEVLGDAAVMSRLSDTKAAKEVTALQGFRKMLNDNPDRAYYGIDHVMRANEAGAIKVLMVTDELFRHQTDIKKRAQYVKLVEDVKESGATVHIFSRQHVSGEQLAQISGVAAILRFPMPDIAEASDDSDDDDDDDDDEELESGGAGKKTGGRGGGLFF
eukprot:g3138.t1